MTERADNPVYIPPDTIGVSVLNRYFFASEHLGICLEKLDGGAIFFERALVDFRQSNSVCRELNVITSVVEGALSARLLLASRGNGLGGKLASTSGLLMLAHTAVSVKGAIEKSRRQAVLNSKESISKQDFRRDK
jgi:hypothetical protein